MLVDLILAGPGITPEFVCDLSDDCLTEDVRLRPGAVRFSNLTLMKAREIKRRANMLAHCDFDAFEVPAGLSVKTFKVLCLDMDGTLIQNECIDDMATLAGVGDEVSAITKAAMSGDTPLTFAECLDKRVACLKGAPTTVITDALAGIKLQHGAPALMHFCRKHGLSTYVLSGGFTNFTRVVAEKLGMTGDVSNVLGVDEETGTLTGLVTGPATAPMNGAILDADGKRRMLEKLCEDAGVPPTAAIAAGDGANDLGMIGAAGIGIAFHAKPLVKAKARWALSVCGLEAISLFFVEAWT